MIRKIIASILICIAVALTLHQLIVYGGWEWDEMFSFFHHEGLAVVTALAGILLFLLPSKKR